MEIATWIIAVCAIISLPISIWAIIFSQKNSVKIKILESSNNYNGNKITVSNANNNGRDGVRIDSKN